MAKYTTELRSILENAAGLERHADYHEIGTVISEAKGALFDFDYPIFDPEYKDVLETKIIKHFWFREIGQETFGKFHFYLDTTMNEIMPYFNQLYNSALIEFNPLYDVDYTKSHSGEDTGNNVFTKDTTRTLNTLDSNGGSLKDSGTEKHEVDAVNTESGSSSESANDTNITENTRRDNLSHTTNETETLEHKNDRMHEETTDEGTVTTNKSTSSTSQDSGTTSDNGTTTNQNTRVNTVNDTPQGGLPADYEDSTMYLTAWTKESTNGSGTSQNTGSHYATNVATGGEYDHDERNLSGSKDVTHEYEDEKHKSGTDTQTGTVQDTSEGSQTHDKSTETENEERVDSEETTTFGKVVTDTRTKAQTGTIHDDARDTEKLSTLSQYTEHVSGHMQGNMSKALMDFRETFLNIDMEVIESLKPLFMNIY